MDDLEDIKPVRRDLADFLDRETTASRISLHASDTRNELINKDLLMPMD